MFSSQNNIELLTLGFANAAAVAFFLQQDGLFICCWFAWLHGDGIKNAVLCACPTARAGVSEFGDVPRGEDLFSLVFFHALQPQTATGTAIADGIKPTEHCRFEPGRVDMPSLMFCFEHVQCLFPVDTSGAHAAFQMIPSMDVSIEQSFFHRDSPCTMRLNLLPIFFLARSLSKLDIWTLP